MKLNPDCLRDIMLYLEDALQFNDEQKYGDYRSIANDTLVKNIASIYNYSAGDINNSLRLLIEGKYLNISTIRKTSDNRIYYFRVESITFDGYEFINNVRPKAFWDKAKERALKVGGASLKVLSTAALQISTLYMTNPEECIKLFGKIPEIVK